MKTPLRLLIVEDSANDAELLVRRLQAGGYEPIYERVETAAAMGEALERQTWDLVICDYVMPQFSGLDALKVLKESGLDLPFIIISGKIGEDFAVEAMKAGAHDYLLKDRLARLIPTIERQLREAQVRREREQAREALQESEERFHIMADTAPVMIWMAGPDRVCNYFNKVWLEFSGGTIEKEQDHWTKNIHPHDLPGFLGIYEKSFEARQPFNLEYRQRRTDGVYRWILNTGVPRFTPGGSFAGYIGSCVDITERRRAEEALRESEARYRRLVESSPEPMFVQSEGKFAYVNPALIKMLGAVDASDLIGKPVLDFVHPDSQELVRERMRQTLEGKEAELEDETWIQFDGQVVLVEAAKTPITYHGEPAGQVVLRDITSRKRLEEQLRQSQKMEAIGRLAGGIAHDFNNIMAVILGYAGFIRAGLKPPDPLIQDSEQIIKSAERAVSLIRQLLAFGRKQVISPIPLDLNSIVRNTQEMLKRLIGEDIEIHTFTKAGLGTVKADPGQMEQLLFNLAVNARDAMPKGGELVIETDHVTLSKPDVRTIPDLQPGDYVILSVKDTGIGMTDEVKTHIYEPFYTTKEIGKGSGLGLSTVYGIVKQHGGVITCHTELGKGTSFKIYFPRVTELAPPATAHLNERSIHEGSETVLVVEDEEPLRELVQLILQKKGYNVITAENGEQALQVSQNYQGRIDLLLTDVVMPKLNGPDLAKQFSKKRPRTRILFTSGHTENVQLLHGIKQAELEFLQKPYTSNMLLQKVREVLDQPEPEDF